MVGMISIMSARPEEKFFREISKERPTIIPPFAEKDWFVTQVLKIVSQINSDEFQIIFSGGTALSKAHKLIHRFSEDIDFRVLSTKENTNRNKRSAFKKTIIEHLRNAGCIIKDEDIKARDANRFFAIDMDYNTHFTKSDFLRPHIQMEFIFRAPQLAPEKHSVASFFTELSKLPPEVPEILCVQPAENAADKLSALTWRITDRVRNSYNDDPSIVRHIHDLALLHDLALQSCDFKNMTLYSMNCDNARPKNDPAFANKSPKEKLDTMFTIIDQDKEYPKEYDRFVKTMSYAPYNKHIPTFQTAIQLMQKLADRVTG